MKVGVTGASGYVGKKVVRELESNNHEVLKFVRRPVKNENEIYWSPSKQEIDIDKFQEFIGQENGHLIYLFPLTNPLIIIQKYLSLLLEMISTVTKETE